jgi:mucin-6/19
VQGSSSVAKRLGTLGLTVFVVGAVLLGTGIAASAHTTTKAAAASANKKKPTTTTTSTTLAPASTTTQPCNAAPATGTASPGKGQGTATATPATCLVNGTQVDISATGLTPASAANYLGTFIECNTDPNQPTVSILGNTIPLSCSSALKYIFTPNAAGTADTSSLTPQPYFTVIEGTTGPACAPTLCTGTDSTGGDPYTDAAGYPCPPTAAQQAAGDSCVIAVGDTGGDQIQIPISFNTAVPVPPTTIGTEAPASASASATTVAAAKTAATKASSGSLAFTGSGPGLWWLALVGVLLMVLGGLLLTVVDQPRRMLRLAVHKVTRTKRDS